MDTNFKKMNTNFKEMNAKIDKGFDETNKILAEINKLLYKINNNFESKNKSGNNQNKEKENNKSILKINIDTKDNIHNDFIFPNDNIKNTFFNNNNSINNNKYTFPNKKISTLDNQNIKNKYYRNINYIPNYITNKNTRRSLDTYRIKIKTQYVNINEPNIYYNYSYPVANLSNIENKAINFISNSNKSSKEEIIN